MRFLMLPFLALLGARVMAGPLEDGTEALRQSDYPAAMKLLRPLAEQGNADAEVLVGSMYLRGWGVPEDPSAGVEWMRKAAGQGKADAQVQLGIAYQEGGGVKQDYSEAMRWYLKAADQGDASAQRSIGMMYADGHGVRKNLAEAQKWFDKARRRPQLPKEVTEGLDAVSSVTLYSLQPHGGPDLPEWDFHGNHVLGHLELTGEKAKSAMAALNDALSAGDANVSSMCIIEARHALRFKVADCTYDILICYHCGQLEVFKDNVDWPFEGRIGGKPDALNRLLKGGHIPLADDRPALNKSYAEEAKAALKMAEQGDAKAQDVLARMLLIGHGVKKNEIEAIRWFSKSLGLGPDDPESQTRFGKLCDSGMPADRNQALALKMFQKAAAQGNAEAQYELAKFYEFGNVVAKDPAAGLKLIQQSAEKGFAEAELDIGARYAQGRDLGQDYPEALKWLQKAAEQAHPEAMYWIATMYAEGNGVAKDPVEAYFWDQLAVAYGTYSGHRITAHLTPEQLALVKKRVADWRATHPERPRRW